MGFDNFKESIPSIKHIWKNVDINRIGSNRKACVYTQEFIMMADRYKIQIIKAIKTYKNPVLYVDKGQIGSMVRQWITESCKEYEQFSLLSSTAAISKFLNHKGKSILFIGTSTIEGVNILAEALIIINTDMIAVTRIRQLLGRLLRPDNPHRNVEINHILYGKYSFLKSLYATCYALETWNMSFNDYPEDSLLLKSAQLMRILGRNPETIDKEDGCILFDSIYTYDRCQEVLVWWKKYKTSNTCLTEEIIIGLYQ